MEGNVMSLVTQTPNPVNGRLAEIGQVIQFRIPMVAAFDRTEDAFKAADGFDLIVPFRAQYGLEHAQR